MNNTIKNFWASHNYVNMSKLWEIIKDNKTPITYSELSNFFKNNKTTQLHKKTIITKSNYVPFVTGSHNFDWQADLLDMSKFSRNNEGYKWILIVIDIFNRKTWAEPLKTKNNNDVTSAFKKIISNNNGDYPKKILTDDGGEFKGSFKKILHDNNVIHRVTISTDHNLLGPINRFSKTLKEIIFKHFTENNTTNWTNKLQHFISVYNDTPHLGICNIKPNEANKYFMSVRECFLNKLENVTKYNFKVGDYVRIRLLKSIFDKGYERTYSKKTYQIKNIVGQSYILNNNSSRRGYDLQKVDKEDLEDKKDQLDKDKSHARFRRRQMMMGIGKVDENGNIIPINKRMIPSGIYKNTGLK